MRYREEQRSMEIRNKSFVDPIHPALLVSMGCGRCLMVSRYRVMS